MTLWKASSVVHVLVGLLVMDRGANPAVAVKITHVQLVSKTNFIVKNVVKYMNRNISVWHH